MDLIPVDICVKGMIVACWKTWMDQKDLKTFQKITKNSLDLNFDEIPVYNAAKIKSISYDTFPWIRNIAEYPPDKAMMYQSTTFTQFWLVEWLVRIVEVFIPGIFFDAALWFFGQKTR